MIDETMIVLLAALLFFIVAAYATYKDGNGRS